ncbi:MAG: hypothetical protein Q4Q53_03580 [Methanocorpusculum sp.]|nr:hypothetical protein [Methanocorpusculum sp.]
MSSKRKFIPAALVIFITLMLFSAGCVTDTYTEILPEISIPMIISPNHDLIIGTWVTYNYTSSAGVHYKKIVDVYYDNNTMDEFTYLDDGTVAEWKAVWVYNKDTSYDAYYAPFTFQLTYDGKSAKLSSSTLGIKNHWFEHADNKTGITGVWVNKIPCDRIPGGYKYMQITLSENGAATGIGYTDSVEDGTQAVGNWTSVGKNMYVFTISDTIHAVIKPDGKLYDNFGGVYTREN